jgi:nitrogen fixation protein
MPPQLPPEPLRHIVSVDVGQVADSSALALIERPEHQPPLQPPLAIRHMDRWHLGTSYLVIVEDVLRFVERKELREPVLTVDQTGVGRPIVDMLRHRVQGPLIPGTITSGAEPTRDALGVKCPKKDLVSTMQLLFGTQRLLIARGVKQEAVLLKELQNFKMKITAAANEIFGSWREGEHDDLVLAAAIGCWVAENGIPAPWDNSVAARLGRSVMSQVPKGVFMSDRPDEGRSRYLPNQD